MSGGNINVTGVTDCGQDGSPARSPCENFGFPPGTRDRPSRRSGATGGGGGTRRIGGSLGRFRVDDSRLQLYLALEHMRSFSFPTSYPICLRSSSSPPRAPETLLRHPSGVHGDPQITFVGWDRGSLGPKRSISSHGPPGHQSGTGLSREAMRGPR